MMRCGNGSCRLDDLIRNLQVADKKNNDCKDESSWILLLVLR